MNKTPKLGSRNLNFRYRLKRIKCLRYSQQFDLYSCGEVLYYYYTLVIHYYVSQDPLTLREHNNQKVKDTTFGIKFQDTN